MSSGRIERITDNLEEDKYQLMNFLKGLFLFTLFIPLPSMAQEKIEFDILFGNYRNDHSKKEFHLSERHWTLSNDTLIRIEDHDNTRYSDTLALIGAEVKAIENFIEKNQLNENLNKDLKNGQLNKWGHEIIIKSSIRLQGTAYQFDLVANSTTAIVEDSDAMRMYNLEELLIELISIKKIVTSFHC